MHLSATIYHITSLETCTC